MEQVRARLGAWAFQAAPDQRREAGWMRIGRDAPSRIGPRSGAPAGAPIGLLDQSPRPLPKSYPVALCAPPAASPPLGGSGGGFSSGRPVARSSAGCGGSRRAAGGGEGPGGRGGRLGRSFCERCRRGAERSGGRREGRGEEAERAMPGLNVAPPGAA